MGCFYVFFTLLYYLIFSLLNEFHCSMNYPIYRSIKLIGFLCCTILLIIYYAKIYCTDLIMLIFLKILCKSQSHNFLHCQILVLYIDMIAYTGVVKIKHYKTVCRYWLEPLVSELSKLSTISGPNCARRPLASELSKLKIAKPAVIIFCYCPIISGLSIIPTNNLSTSLGCFRLSF